MLIFEVTTTAEKNLARLAALAMYHIGRERDTGSKEPMSVDAFIKMAKNLGISLTSAQLRDMVGKSPLNALIKNIEGDSIVFRDSDDSGMTAMSVDRARKTVDKMSRRAAKKGD